MLKKHLSALFALLVLVFLGVGAVTYTPLVSGTPVRDLDVDETELDIKTSPGFLTAIWISNTTASWRYLKCYNDTAANVSVGSTTPYFTVPIPPGATGNLSTGNAPNAFSVALSCAATTAVGDADTGAPGANDLIATYFVK